jgi:hypothetical protein
MSKPRAPNKAWLSADDGWLPGEFVENGEEDKPNADGWWPGSIVHDPWEPGEIIETDDEEELEVPDDEERRESEATEWLAAKPDLKTMKRDDHRDECTKQFRITRRGYQRRVWPEARKLAGLTKRGKPGPKAQTKKS